MQVKSFIAQKGKQEEVNNKLKRNMENNFFDCKF